ncbi:MAG: hydroxymethylglutaryl-CoA reductase (NADPH) [Candidatus Micrarchaeota archaeon]|nr:hydroxymethylglutaryl-CoA reductase (NADPH) [Candidatus Micrarchaeota archaeon]
MDELVRKLVKGKIGFHDVQKLTSPGEAVEVRRKALEELTKAKLEHIGKYSIDLGFATNRNIDNPIGVTQVPLGIAGPARINGEYAKGSFYVPLATTEGALVASVNRGMRAISESGGCSVRILHEGMTRAPLFKVRNVSEAVKLRDWANSNFYKLKELMEEDKFLKLKEVQPFITGRHVFLRFVCDTSDAMGMNMITIGLQRVVEFIEKENRGTRCIALSGNMCTDKKPSAANFILGRGRSVTADVAIPKRVVDKVLKTTPKRIVEVNYGKNFIGSARAGVLGGFNAHVANPIAALYIACGQDPAQIMNSAMAITSAEEEGDGVYFSIFMPSIESGALGGGMNLPTQKEALQILGCYGPGEPAGNNARKFSEIACATALAGEISLISALAAGQLARAHDRLGRGKG